MSINEKTKYRIANKYDSKTKSYLKDEFDFEDKGNYGTGKLSWSTSKKDKHGKQIFTSSTVKFICFGETKSFIAANLRGKFKIDASLSNESFTNQKGEKISFWQLTVFSAELAEITQHDAAKANAYQPEAEEELDDTIPF